MVKRDRWAEATEAHLEELRQRRRGVVDDANAFKAEAERRLQAYRNELDAVKAEISAVENALESHRVRCEATALAEPAPTKALPPGPTKLSAPSWRTGERSDLRDRIKDWVREHDGQLVIGALVDVLVAEGRYGHKASAQTQIGVALNSIRTGFVRVSRGVYRFHSVDGQALRPLEEAELAAPA